VYLAAIATHPLAAMLKGFDLQVYLGGARQAMRHPRDLYTWTDDGHLGIKFTYPRSRRCFSPPAARSRSGCCLAWSPTWNS
jgi:hypothetical protein